MENVSESEKAVIEEAFEAVSYRCDLQALQELVLNRGLDLNSQNPVWPHGTLLHRAAKNGNFEIVKYLLEKGAQLEAKDKWGQTALHLAAWGEHLETVKYLIEKGAELEPKDKWGNTPLHLALERGHINVVEYLVEKGADVKATDKDGQTPLHRGIQYERYDVVKCLVEKGADVKATDKDGETPLHLAAWSGNRDVVEYLVEKGADVKATDKDGQTPLHLAARSGRYDVVKCLVEKGADVKATDKDGQTPLHLAAKDGRLGDVKYLVEKGAQVLATNWSGLTPSRQAAENGHLAIVNYLTEMARNVDTTAETDLTPLNAVSNQETDSNLQLSEHELSVGYSIYLGDLPAPEENNAMQQGGSKRERTINSEFDEEESDGVAVPTKKPKTNEEPIRPIVFQDDDRHISPRLDITNNKDVQLPVPHDDPAKGLDEHMDDEEASGLPADGQADDLPGSSLAGAPTSSEVNGFQALLQKFEVEIQEKLKAFADLFARAETAVRKLEVAADACSGNRLQVAQQAPIVLNISELPTSHIMAGSFPDSSALPTTSVNSRSESSTMEYDHSQHQGPADDAGTEQATHHPFHPGTSRVTSSTGTNEETPDLTKLETLVNEATDKTLPQFVVHLMTGLFSRGYLATHALSDGSNKFGKPGKITRKPMDSKARDAIIAATRKKFPDVAETEIRKVMRRKFNNSTSKE